MSDGWDEEAFQLQQTFLQRLQKMPLKELKFLHRETFNKLKSKFNPPWMPRVVWERRLFLLFASRNYHQEGAEKKRFLSLSKDVLTSTFKGNYLESIDKQVQRTMNTHGNFTAEQIASMDLDTVERFLIKLGYEWEADSLRLRDLKQLLWEYFNLPASETWKTRTQRDGETRRLKKPHNFSMKLRDVLLENREMGWIEFCDKFGERMPAVTHGSFRTSRYDLKKMGHDMPPLKQGRPRKE